MIYSDRRELVKKISVGLKKHGEEFRDASTFFKRLEEIIYPRIAEISERELEETQEYASARDVLHSCGITFVYVNEHSIKGRFGEEERQIGRDDWETIDEGVEIDESTFADPENNKFIQELAQKRKEIEELDREISSIESQLSRTIFGKNQLQARLDELKSKRARISIRGSEEKLERLILEHPEKREEILQNIKTLNALGRSEGAKRSDAEYALRLPYEGIDRVLEDTIATIVSEENINLERVINQLRVMINTVKVNDQEMRRFKYGPSKISDLEHIIDRFLESDLSKGLTEGSSRTLDSLADDSVRSMSLGELEDLDRQVDEAISQTDQEIEDLTIEERRKELAELVIAKLGILGEKRLEVDRLKAQRDSRTSQIRPEQDLQ